jgi:hypothetical protein
MESMGLLVISFFGLFFALIVGLGVATVFGLIIYSAASSLAERSRNNGLPIEDLAARVVSKRVEMGGGGGSRRHASRRVWTAYYVTFETRSGERREFELSGPQFGVLVEGDEGTLRHQGTRYHDFFRSNVKASSDLDF